MFIEIINAITGRLSEKLTAATKLLSGEQALALRNPAIKCYIGPVAYERIGQSDAARVTARVNLLIEFKKVGDLHNRLAGAWAIAESVFAYLAFRDLGLDIAPLVPESLRDTTTNEQDKEGIAQFHLVFMTYFDSAIATDEEAEELLKLGMELYLQEPGDDNQPDMSALSDLSQQPQ